LVIANQRKSTTVFCMGATIFVTAPDGRSGGLWRSALQSAAQKPTSAIAAASVCLGYQCAVALFF
jgi:hypothetical protein